MSTQRVSPVYSSEEIKYGIVNPVSPNNPWRWVHSVILVECLVYVQNILKVMLCSFLDLKECWNVWVSGCFIMLWFYFDFDLDFSCVCVFVKSCVTVISGKRCITGHRSDVTVQAPV